MGFAVVAYRTQRKDEGAEYVCKLVTRTLTLLDNSLTKVSVRVQRGERNLTI